MYWWFSDETISKSAKEILEIKRISNEFKFFNCKMCLALRRWERFARFPSGEERGETDVFAGYVDEPSEECVGKELFRCILIGVVSIFCF